MSQNWVWFAVVGVAVVSYPIVAFFTDNSGDSSSEAAAASSPRPTAAAPPSSTRDAESPPKTEIQSLPVRQPATEPPKPTPPAPLNPRKIPVDEVERWVAFVVPGTYGNAGSWFTLVPGQATFSSELQRSLGPQARVHPFLWRSSVHHSVREKAAENLAKEIKEKTRPGDKIMLVGHSHGGNVALRAAGMCGRKIDLVVCLATPHVYCRLKSGTKIFSLPVYCPPESRATVAEIVTLTACTDDVPSVYADLRKGIDENDAIFATRGWRDHIRGAALATDGDWLTEVVEDALETKVVSNLVVSARLNLTKHNVIYPCSISSNMGAGAHQAVHSRRIGGLLGRLAMAESEPQRQMLLNYLGTLSQTPGEDFGEAIAEATQRRNDQARDTLFQHSGWYLLNVEITSQSRNDRIHHLFASDPDPYFELRLAGGTLLHRSSHRSDTKTARWVQPGVVVPMRGAVKMQVFEKNPVEDDAFESQPLAIGASGPPTSVVSKNWSAKLKWLKVHE